MLALCDANDYRTKVVPTVYAFLHFGQRSRLCTVRIPATLPNFCLHAQLMVLCSSQKFIDKQRLQQGTGDHEAIPHSARTVCQQLACRDH